MLRVLGLQVSMMNLSISMTKCMELATAREGLPFCARLISSSACSTSFCKCLRYCEQVSQMVVDSYKLLLARGLA